VVGSQGDPEKRKREIEKGRKKARRVQTTKTYGGWEDKFNAE
jgi:hypothetical protein